MGSGRNGQGDVHVNVDRDEVCFGDGNKWMRELQRVGEWVGGFIHRELAERSLPCRVWAGFCFS